MLNDNYSVKNILNDNNSKIKTKITKIEQDKLITRGHCQKNLIENLSYIEMIYLILKGEVPSKKIAKILNYILVSFCDHGVTPPSTQAARLIASSGSPINVALSGALLSFGKNHAGAIEKSMELLQNIVIEYDLNDSISDENIEKIAINIVNEFLENKIKIPGYGHRYHKKDPRAEKLMEIAIKEDFVGIHTKLALAIEKVLIDEKNIRINVDGANSGILLDLGFSSKEGIGFFIIGRLPGLIAHTNEEMMDESCFRKFLTLDDIDYQGKTDSHLNF
ncbi:citryl-CoA lyase [Methanobrevibacter filiformis]|uniref:2-methylcitrate synthase n=1 Tax=Methanobrevibacter filiformis TaxID=55758 RepID=A0A165Z6A5_9EURY|nr:citryl-CoA lyase [Methanobrevibacter filiformis]KZX10299.1 2-methylcitrate synthase [Methanobrevibacter filiformis]